MSPHMGPVVNGGREVQVTINVDTTKLMDALRSVWEAMTEAVKPVVAAFQTIGQAFARYNASTPEAKALRELDAALDWSEHHLEQVLLEVRHDLLRGVSWRCQRERMWAALTWGLTEADALERAAYVMRRRFPLDLTEDEAAQVAVAILEGYVSRPAAWR